MDPTNHIKRKIYSMFFFFLFRYFSNWFVQFIRNFHLRVNKSSQYIPNKTSKFSLIPKHQLSVFFVSFSTIYILTEVKLIHLSFANQQSYERCMKKKKINRFLKKWLNVWFHCNKNLSTRLFFSTNFLTDAHYLVIDVCFVVAKPSSILQRLFLRFYLIKSSTNKVSNCILLKINVSYLFHSLNDIIEHRRVTVYTHTHVHKTIHTHTHKHSPHAKTQTLTYLYKQI